MVVKARTGRKRYIAFEVVSGGGQLTRSRLTRIIESRAVELGFRNRPEVIFISSGRGILRSDHRALSEAKEILESISSADPGLEIRTLLTSGTIKTLKVRFFAHPRKAPNAPSR